ncbi:MAG: 50S ribosomal protein L11 methyltransferase [Candidatus Micrarchaeota archaeon]|nr:50S ribosomal protein L11 methyltransferase [Candidatus Micrarchaeota archaeon]
MKEYVPPILSLCKRGPQVVLPKDIGLILAYSGVGKNSLVVDAGSGSGWLAISLANIARKVVSYEWREEFARLAEQNAKRAGVSESLEIKRKNVFDGIDEEGVDLVTLDLAEAHKALPHAYSALKEGGFVFGYFPNIEQAKTFYEECQKIGFSELHMVESFVRHFLVRQAGTRPQNTGLVHTGYIVFGRKQKP